MSSPIAHTIAHDNDPDRLGQADCFGETEMETLLRDAGEVLRVSSIWQFLPSRRRKYGVLAQAIEQYFQRRASTALGLATAAAAQHIDLPDAVIMDAGDRPVAPTAQGVWLRAKYLVDWDLILPLLPRFMNARYAAAIAERPFLERSVFLLHRMGGLELDEVAGRLACDVRTCEQLLAQALSGIALHVEKARPADVED
ncbi:Sigma-70, region 4 [Sphingobium sp. AP50]|uniref:sigma-70 region 4 domain-containing protein n=1 Tax=Sphingobium sp. AP50 TaxID=1884369 RepID=UPI0008C571ED|nr:sigma factor-like helix-turn-helix DNA-binding protein [Sphingobium sp. AP50]SEJ91996.1 Sigma-70, region 4 [Sphingobium sp. AP50]